MSMNTKKEMNDLQETNDKREITFSRGLSNKQCKILNLAIEAAEKSPMGLHHGAVLVFRGKPVTTNCNNFRTYINGQLMLSSHAEVATMYKFRRLKKGVQEQQRVLRKKEEHRHMLPGQTGFMGCPC